MSESVQPQLVASGSTFELLRLDLDLGANYVFSGDLDSEAADRVLRFLRRS